MRLSSTHTFRPFCHDYVSQSWSIHLYDNIVRLHEGECLYLFDIDTDRMGT